MPHLPGLDGLRGVALVIVLLYHHGVTWMTGGELTVSMFFYSVWFFDHSLSRQRMGKIWNDFPEEFL